MPAAPRAPLLVATKLEVPPPRPGHVPRPALVQQLRGAVLQRLTLLSAPPGTGKTTLLAEWSRTAGGPGVAWLSLDPEESDPVAFWTGVIAALRHAGGGLGRDAEAALHAAGADLVRAVVAPLLNDLAERPDPLVLVLDDYHVVESEDVHRALAYLVERAPPHFRVMLATRSDPPLPLARLRARGELLELRAADLRFSETEAGGLLNGALGLELDGRDVARLAERTEGWAAGLQLAGLSLRGRTGGRELIDSFAGDDRHVVDYLGAEVLSAQPPELRSFMRRTAILERLTAPLCDAVTGCGESAEMLERIERENLFLVPLDDRRQWYRYHGLFADLLRLDLRRTEPDVEPALHRAAAAWHREHGLIPGAIGHALAAGDRDDAAVLVAEHWSEWFNRGRLVTVARWLEELGEEMVGHEGELWLARVWTALDRGRLDEAGRLIADGSGPWVPVVIALHRFKRGEVAEAHATARAGIPVAVVGERAAFLATVAHLVLGVSAYWRGEHAEALEALSRARALAEDDENRLGAAYAGGYLGLLAQDAGDHATATDEVARCRALAAAEPGVAEQFVFMVAHLVAAREALAAGTPQAALGDAERALELSRRGAGRVELAAALLVAAEACGRESGGYRLAEAAALLGTHGPAPLVRKLEALRSPHPRRAADSGEALSPAELAVLRLLPSSLTQREIGSELFLSLNTIKTHTRRIMAKLDARSREEAVAHARQQGLL